MAQQTVKEGKSKKRQVEAKEVSYQALLNRFMLSESKNVRGRDGKMYELFHRMGPEGGAYTFEYIFDDIFGLQGELLRAEKDANKRYKVGSDELREVVHSRHAYLKGIARSRVRSFKTALQKEYEAQGLIPLVGMVRIHSQDDERKFYIQGFLNRNGEHVLGDRDDAALWVIDALAQTEGVARFHALAYTVGKDLVKKGLTGPLRDRLTERLT